MQITTISRSTKTGASTFYFVTTPNGENYQFGGVKPIAIRFNTIDEMRKCYAKYTATKSRGGYGYRPVPTDDYIQMTLAV